MVDKMVDAMAGSLVELKSWRSQGHRVTTNVSDQLSSLNRAIAMEVFHRGRKTGTKKANHVELADFMPEKVPYRLSELISEAKKLRELQDVVARQEKLWAKEVGELLDALKPAFAAAAAAAEAKAEPEPEPEPESAAEPEPGPAPEPEPAREAGKADVAGARAKSPDRAQTQLVVAAGPTREQQLTVALAERTGAPPTYAGGGVEELMQEVAAVRLVARRSVADGADVHGREGWAQLADRSASHFSDERGTAEYEHELSVSQLEWASHQWETVALPPASRVRQKRGQSLFQDMTNASTAAWLPDGRLVVCSENPGMEDPDGDHDEVLLTQDAPADLEIFNPNLLVEDDEQQPPGVWQRLPRMAEPRLFPALCALSDGSFLVVGGYDHSRTMLATAERFVFHGPNHASPSSPAKKGASHLLEVRGKWVPAGRLAHPRDGFGISQLRDGRVMVAGGTHYPFGVQLGGLRTCEVWAQKPNNAWVEYPAMNAGHSYAAGCSLPNGHFVLSGGYDRQVSRRHGLTAALPMENP